MFTLNVNTDQEAFDKVWKHLSTMTGRCYSEERQGCLYAGPKGNRCAVSTLIDATHEEVSVLDKEITGVSTLVRDGKLDIGKVKLTLLIDLQNAHDFSHRWSPDETRYTGWDTLRRLAQDHGLNAPKEDPK